MNRVATFLKIKYRHRTDTTKIWINTIIYYRAWLTTGSFIGIYVICIIARIYHYRHFTGNLQFYTTDYRR